MKTFILFLLTAHLALVPEIAPAQQTSSPDQSGRSGLIWTSVAYSLLFYGWALPTVLDITDGKKAVGLYMMVGTAGFFVPFLGTRNAAVTEGTAALTATGAGLGTLHGILLPYLFYDKNGVSARGVIGSAMLVSIGEGIAGYVIGKNSNIGVGKAEMVGTLGGLYGGLTGFLLGASFGFADNIDDRATSIRPLVATTLAGSVAGMYFADYLTDVEFYTGGDAAIVNTTVPLALFNMTSILSLTTVTTATERKLYSALAAASLFGGAIVGNALVAGRDFETSDASIMLYGTLGGGLFGLGVGYFTSVADRTLPLLTSLGATAGFILTYTSFSGDRIATGRPNHTGLNIQVSPLGLASAFSKNPALAAPLLTVSGKF